MSCKGEDIFLIDELWGFVDGEIAVERNVIYIYYDTYHKMSLHEGLEFRHVEVIGVTVNKLPSP